ncbi:MAG TPA: type VI secretion system baseplate subunit TssG [Duganella sp.]|nr:type VI secretion system baseplate subunit TssG [Duganella sp.]
MSTTKRHEPAGLIQQLLDEPYRFEFVQAVLLLERLLAERGLDAGTALSDFLRFRNSTSERFPASEIEALQIRSDTGSYKRATEQELVAALDQGRLGCIAITPTFIGFLGNHGVLPNHYGERIASHQLVEKDGGAAEFLDIFSNRMVALFYQAWRKHRPELPQASGAPDGLRSLMLSLCGSQAQPVPDRVAAHYAAAFAHRPVSAAMVENVLNDYFRVPIRVVPHAGRWHALEPRLQSALGTQNCLLSAGAVLGTSMWRRDLVVVIRLGPLDKRRYDDFLKDSAGAAALKNMLAMFETPTLRYEVQLVLRAADVQGITLSAAAGARLGIDAFLATGPAGRDRFDTRYMI